METNQILKEAENLLNTITFSEFTKKVNDSFNALTMLTELYKSNNEDLINILNSVENGR